MMTHKNRFSLTEREMEVLRLITYGYNNTEIANMLFITIHTTKAHVASILVKLEETNRTKAAVKAVKFGLVEV